MNSKQRRGQRVFVHEVTLFARTIPGERYLDFDRRVELAKGWLQWTTKRKNYTMGPKQYSSQTFKFRTGGLAIAFALRWS